MQSIHRMAALALLAGFVACQETLVEPTGLAGLSADIVVQAAPTPTNTVKVTVRCARNVTGPVDVRWKRVGGTIISTGTFSCGTRNQTVVLAEVPL